MKAVQIRPFQQKAIDSIGKALELGKNHIVLEMPAGCGKSIILVETLNRLILNNSSKVLIVTNSVSEKKQMEDFIYTNYKEFIHVSESNIEVENEQKLLHNRGNSIDSYQYIVFFETIMSQKIYETLKVYEKTIIVFSTYSTKRSHRLFELGDVVFSYSYEQAIIDGVITPAMDPRAFNPAVEIFCGQLLQQFGYAINDSCTSEKNEAWDLCFTNLGKKIYVECKTYKSQIVSVSAANSLLNTILMPNKK